MSDDVCIELTCLPSQKQAWIEWLLEHHKGQFDVSQVQRFGLPEDQLAPHEQVAGSALRIRFSFKTTRHAWQALKPIFDCLPHTEKEWMMLPIEH